MVSGSDFATTVKVRLTVSPGTAGFNDFAVRVTDYNTGATVHASSVQLEFTQPLRPQLGQSTLTLKRQIGRHLCRSRGQPCRRRHLGDRGDHRERRQLHRSAPPADHAQPAASRHGHALQRTCPPCTPIQLQDGWLAQVYIDPDKAGADEFHVTFFTNPNETSEIHIASVTVGMTPPGRPPTILVSRRLDPIGHFVADATVTAGATRYDIIATTETGVAIATYVTITPGP